MGACQACDVTNEVRQQEARLHVAFVQLSVNRDFYVLLHSTFLLESPLSGRKRLYCMLLNARGILPIENQTNPNFAGRNPLMRLERLHTHQFIRVLRVVLPLVVIVLVAVPSWNYWSRRQQPKRTFTPKELPKDIAVRTENFSLTRLDTKSGRTLFTIQSKTNVGFLDNSNMLE